MNEAIQGSNNDASPALTVKRKRGRPRKDKTLSRIEGVRRRKFQNLNSVENAGAPAGFHVVNGGHACHVNSVEDASDVIVGQAVTGVVEAVFDAGYLLSVKIGDSSTNLRGVVFKPGHYAPVTAENDVAPRVQMIRRNEIHLSIQNQTRGRGARSRHRHGQHVVSVENGSQSNELNRIVPLTTNMMMPSNGKFTAIVAAPSVHAVGARGTVDPVVLEPVNTTIGQPPTQQMSSSAAHVTTLKGRHVQTVTPLAVYDPNGLITSHSQTSSHQAPKVVNNEDGTFDRHENEGKSMNSKDTYLTGEVGEEFKGPLQSLGTHNIILEEAGKLPVEGPTAVVEQENSDMSEPLYVEPLRTVHTNFYNQSPYVVGHNGVGRMTELLQAVHENVKGSQLRTGQVATCSEVELHEQRMPDAGLGD